MKSILAILVLLTGMQANALEAAGFVGFNNTEFDGPGDWDREFGWEFGMAYDIPMQGAISIRTGAGIVQKASEADGINRKLEYVFLEIPGTVMYTFNKYISIFGGLNLDVTLADDGDKSEAFAINLVPAGARFKWAQRHSLETIFEFGLLDIDDAEVQIANSVSFRYRYEFTVNYK